MQLRSMAAETVLAEQTVLHALITTSPRQLGPGVLVEFVVEFVLQL